jgi:hypothetical protein
MIYLHKYKATLKKSHEALLTPHNEHIVPVLVARATVLLNSFDSQVRVNKILRTNSYLPEDGEARAHWGLWLCCDWVPEKARSIDTFGLRKNIDAKMEYSYVLALTYMTHPHMNIDNLF